MDKKKNDQQHLSDININLNQNIRHRTWQAHKLLQCQNKPHNNCRNIEEFANKFRELPRLRRQKEQLQKQLASFKQGGLSTLLQKQELVNHLKNYSHLYWHFEDQKEQLLEDMDKINRKNKDIIQQNKQLTNSIEKLRKLFFQEYQYKQIIIDNHLLHIAQLENQVHQLIQENQQLQSSLSRQQQKVRTLEFQIHALKIEFNITSNYPNQSIALIQLIEEHKLEIQQIIAHYENQMKLQQNLYNQQLKQSQLHRTLETQQGSQINEFNGLKSMQSYFQPEFKNLNVDLIKNLQNTWKSSEMDMSMPEGELTNSFNNQSFHKTQILFQNTDTFKKSFQISNVRKYQAQGTLLLCSNQKFRTITPKLDTKIVPKNNKLYFSAALGFITGIILTHVSKKILS